MTSIPASTTLVAFARAHRFALLESMWAPSAAFRDHPRNKNCPAEVEMELATSYQITIPKDAIPETNTAGLLGEVYVNIDTTRASGAPIENCGYLKSKPSQATLSPEDRLKAADAVLRFVQVVEEAEKDAVPPAHR